VVNGVRVQVGEQAQAVAGELLPRAGTTQERWLDLVAGATGLLKRVQNHRIDLAHALARRAELRGGLDNPPSEVRGLIERHEQLRAGGRGSGENARGLLPADMPSGMAPHMVWEIVEGHRRNVWRSNTAGEG
jgi:hypothetical protein